MSSHALQGVFDGRNKFQSSLQSMNKYIASETSGRFHPPANDTIRVSAIYQIHSPSSEINTYNLMSMMKKPKKKTPPDKPREPEQKRERRRKKWRKPVHDPSPCRLLHKLFFLRHHIFIHFSILKHLFCYLSLFWLQHCIHAIFFLHLHFHLIYFLFIYSFRNYTLITFLHSFSYWHFLSANWYQLWNWDIDSALILVDQSFNRHFRLNVDLRGGEKERLFFFFWEQDCPSEEREGFQR